MFSCKTQPSQGSIEEIAHLSRQGRRWWLLADCLQSKHITASSQDSFKSGMQNRVDSRGRSVACMCQSHRGADRRGRSRAPAAAAGCTGCPPATQLAATNIQAIDATAEKAQCRNILSAKVRRSGIQRVLMYAAAACANMAVDRGRTLTKSMISRPAASIFRLSVSLTPSIHCIVSTRRVVASQKMVGVRTRGTCEYSSANRSQLCPSYRHDRCRGWDRADGAGCRCSGSQQGVVLVSWPTQIILSLSEMCPDIDIHLDVI